MHTSQIGTVLVSYSGNTSRTCWKKVLNTYVVSNGDSSKTNDTIAILGYSNNKETIWLS